MPVPKAAPAAPASAAFRNRVRRSSFIVMRSSRFEFLKAALAGGSPLS
jgi:hypothetical protein